jgi:RNA recognition motif-containing protein
LQSSFFSVAHTALVKMGDNQSQPCDNSAPSAECELLAYLMRVLNQRPEQSLLLSDLGALLPEHVRVAMREHGGLRTCVQKFSIFKVSGQPGRERVTLLLGAEQGVEQNLSLSEVAQSGSAPLSQSAAYEPSTMSEVDDEYSDEKDNSVVQLRGLPYKATEDDVRKFLGSHLVNLKDFSSIQLLLSRDGRPSGFARVQFSCPATARAACQDLHERVMQLEVDNLSGAGSSSRHRYVEVFLHSENPSKVRFKKRSPISGQEDIDPALEAAAARISPDQIADEVRQYMGQDGKGELLLSMLGVALSPAARLHLRKSDCGVKSFLAQYPNEFVISGAKGREHISYVPIQPSQDSQFINDCSVRKTSIFGKIIDGKSHADRTAKVDADDLDMPPTSNPKIWSSPDAGEDSRNFSKLGMSPSFFRTPSNWGTPDANQGSRSDIIADIFVPGGQPMDNHWGFSDFSLDFNPPPPPDPRFSSDAAQAAEAQGAPPMVRLRGLPFDTTKQEVCSLFSHKGICDRISDGSNPIQILTKNNGKPTGNALVQLRKVEDIAVVQKVLHLTTFGTRYIEVLPHSATGGQGSNPQLRQGPADRVQLNTAQSAPQMMAGSTMYSDAWLLSQLAMTVAQCSPEHNAYNAGFDLMPGEAFNQRQDLRV